LPPAAETSDTATANNQKLLKGEINEIKLIFWQTLSKTKNHNLNKA
jgi:hypothetical protein